ncbi:AF4/FMR2 family member 1-like [Melopsittacus undulatus]|uniref:AF4/FMR2 family member 1-like n=1 Tax=Melopsittacus undulatus TaxID=13146 RepID=UPI00146D108D|nr:AF4/FMR2 family member 1-like [Melopsittacus undulatus]
MGFINSKKQRNFLGLQRVLLPASHAAPHVPHSFDKNTFGKSSDSKVNARAQRSKSEIPSGPIKRTLHCDAQTVNEILKEMTQPWLPLLTDIPASPTAEPSKFPFPTKRKAVDEETNRKKLKLEKEQKSLKSSPKKDSKKLK